MDAQTFETVLDSADSLIVNQVDDLVAAGVASEVREDGLPQDWVDSMADLTPDQADEVRAKFEGESIGWMQALVDLL